MIYVTPIITLIKITIYEIYVWVPWRLLWCILCSIYSSYWARNLKKNHKIPMYLKQINFMEKNENTFSRKKISWILDLHFFFKLLWPIVSYSFWSLGISRFTNLSFEKKWKWFMVEHFWIILSSSKEIKIWIR